MAKYGFSRTEELIFAKVNDYDQCSTPPERCNINYANSYEDNFHQKRDKTYPYMHENSDIEQLGIENSIFCNKNSESCASKFSKYRYETENQSLGKRNRYLPHHFSDYYIEMPGNDDYLGKTSPSCSKIYRKEWSENDDFELSENQNTCAIKNSRGFDNGNDYKHHNERYIFAGNNRCFPSTNHFTKLAQNKRRYLRKTPSLSTNNFERKWEKNNYFKQFEIHNNCFSKNSRGFDDSDFKYQNEKDIFVGNNRYFESNPHIPRIETQNKRRYFRKAPSFSANNSEKKSTKREDFKYSENQNSFFIKNDRQFEDDKYYNERDIFIKNNRYFAIAPHSCPAELPQSRYARETPSLSTNNFEKEWKKNYDFAQSRNKHIYVTKKSIEYGDDINSNYYHENQTLTERNSCLHSDLGDYFTEIHEKKRDHLSKMESPCVKNYEKKCETCDNFVQFGKECSFPSDKITVANENNDPIYNHEEDTKTLIGSNYLPNPSDNYVIETPKKKTRKTASSWVQNSPVKWEKNEDFEQSRKQSSFSYDKIPVACFSEGSIYNYEVDASLLNDRHRCSSSYVDYNSIETPPKKSRCIKKTPDSNGKKYEKKWERNGNVEQNETKCGFSCDVVTVASDNEGSIHNYELHTRPSKESHSCLPSYLDTKSIETPKKTRRCVRKTLFSTENNCEKNQKKNGDDEKSDIQWSFPYDKISETSDNEGFLYNYKVDTRPLEDKHSCLTSHLDNNSIETPKMKRRYIRKTPYSTENKCEKKWTINCDSEQSETQSSCDNKECHEANTKFLRERNSTFPSRFNDYIVETPNKKRPFSKKTPSSSSKLIRKKRNEFSLNNSEDNISYFSNCSFFKNPEFVNRLMFFNDKDLDDTFVTDKSKDVMLCSDSETNTSLIITENQKVDDDIMHIFDCPHTLFNEKDSDGTFVTGKSIDSILFSDYELYECSILMENQKANDGFICICPQACFNDKDSDDTFETETNKDEMLFSDYESYACLIITENQNADNDIIHISDCYQIFLNETNSDDMFATERSNEVLLYSDYKSYACSITTKNLYTDEDVMHVGDFPQMIFDGEDLDDTLITERGKDVMLSNGYKSDTYSVITENHHTDNDIIHTRYSPVLFNNEQYLDGAIATEIIKDVMLGSD